ncbi:MAG TPA: META domain-containing protein [Chloroflexi bacterium]|nr:MAG: hypothetical protein DRI46_03715 [Chloroflexota bacterium]HDN05355.1 META domain-containing protein [Chloroflexota bacterium]
MKKRLYVLLGIIAAISFAIGVFIFVFNDQFIYKRSLEGQWKLARVLVDGKRAPGIDQESDIDIVYYWNEQSVIFQPESIHGYDGCNNYRGDLKLGPKGRLDISRIESSLKGCPEGYQKISDYSRVLVTKYDSSQFIQDLLFVDRVEIRNNNLVLIDDGPPIKELFFERED